MANQVDKSKLIDEFNNFRQQLGDLEFRKMLVKDRLRMLNEVLLKVEQEEAAAAQMAAETKTAVVEAEKADGK